MIYAIRGSRPQDTKWEVAHDFADWCRVVGLECQLIDLPSLVKEPGSTVLVWGWRLGKVLKAAGHRVVVMERGYVGDRMSTWTSFGVDGLNGRAKWHIPTNAAGDRFSMYHEHLYKPWSPGGEYVLVIGQVPGDQSLEGMDPIAWGGRAAASVKHLNLPIYYRPHPTVQARGDKRVPVGAQLCPVADLDEALSRAALVLTYSSTTAVQALLAGKPTIASHPCSMAYVVAPASLVSGYDKEPLDRREWAEMLAWKQWTPSEIRSGHPFFWLLEEHKHGG